MSIHQESSNNKITSNPLLPTPLRLINSLGVISKKAGISLAPIKIDSVIQSAIKKTKTNNTDTDLSYLFKPLENLINSLNETNQLNLTGRVFTKQLLIDQISNRIRIDAELKARPEILDEKIEKPIFILGFPRTGTTLLHNLLSQSSGYRFPYMWETLCPSIYPDARKGYSKDRIANAVKVVKFIDYVNPQLKSIHPLYPEGPDECLKLIESSFTAPHIPLYFHTPQYWDWFKAQQKDKLRAVYARYKQQLQLLQWHRPQDTWVLKTPIHLYFLPELLDTFPDARIIQLHRDPYKVTASFCSLVAACRSLYSDIINMEEIGQFVMDFMTLSTKRAMEAENSNSTHSFCHVNYTSLISHPEKEIMGIYKQLGLTYTSAIEEGITRWISSNPKGKHGTHNYSLEQYGLSEQIVDDNLQDYSDKYLV